MHPSPEEVSKHIDLPGDKEEMPPESAGIKPEEKAPPVAEAGVGADALIALRETKPADESRNKSEDEKDSRDEDYKEEDETKPADESRNKSEDEEDSRDEDYKEEDERKSLAQRRPGKAKLMKIRELTQIRDGVEREVANLVAQGTADAETLRAKGKALGRMLKGYRDIKVSSKRFPRSFMVGYAEGRGTPSINFYFSSLLPPASRLPISFAGKRGAGAALTAPTIGAAAAPTIAVGARVEAGASAGNESAHEMDAPAVFITGAGAGAGVVS
ncbi:MAG TPA: hypothetical protein VJB02_00030, partial [Coxiellaceae bacterium]|nr:hypothetical protein [Coxiellaceae bacterium]